MTTKQKIDDLEKRIRELERELEDIKRERVHMPYNPIWPGKPVWPVEPTEWYVQPKYPANYDIIYHNNGGSK